MNHILHDFFRRIKAERGRVANIKFNDTAAFVFQTFGFVQYWAADVITDIVELIGFAHLGHLSLPLKYDIRRDNRS